MPKKYRIKTLIGLALIVVGGGAYSISSHESTVHASGGLSFSKIATHPYASKTGYDQDSKNHYTGAKLCPPQDGEMTSWCPVGQVITDLGFTDRGELVGGYGEWSSNVDTFGVAAGGVYLQPFNVQTKTWGKAVRAGSEAIDKIRELDGEVYAPTTDPSDITADGQSQNNMYGYATTAGGGRFVSIDRTGIHGFDIVKKGNEIWFAGNKHYGNGGAAGRISYSPDNGQTWTADYYLDKSAAGQENGWERTYWMAKLGDTIYFQTAGTTPSTPMRSYNTQTNEWRNIADTSIYFHNKDVVEFDGHIVWPESSTIAAFDGTTKTTMTGLSEALADIYSARDGNLYALGSSGNIYRSNAVDQPFQKITKATSIPGGATSIAVFNDIVYLGADRGEIYASTTSLSEMPSITPEILTVSPSSISLDGRDKTISITGHDLATASVYIDDIKMRSQVYTSGEEIMVTLDTEALLKKSHEERAVDVRIELESGMSTTLEDGLQLTVPRQVAALDALFTNISDPDLRGATISVPQSSQCFAIERATEAEALTKGLYQGKYFGALDFALRCKSGARATVTISLPRLIAQTSLIRIYKISSNTNETPLDITRLVDITSPESGGLALNYTIEDGGQLDDDGIVNGMIMDPIVITTAPNGSEGISVANPSTNQQQKSTNTDKAGIRSLLAATGLNVAALIAVATTLMVIGAGLWMLNRKRKSS